MYSSATDSNASCHTEAAGVEEVCKGFLIKSPPSRQIRNMKSWKRRFFVLSKTNDSSHELKYYKSTERDKPIKSIDSSTITMLQVNPEANPDFEWICKTFKCSPDTVLLMKTENPGAKVQREFFFIGDTRFAMITISVTVTSEDSLLDCVTKAFDKMKTPQTSTESHGQSLASIFLFLSSVSKCGEIQASCLFHKGDQILAVNDLLTDTVEEVQTYLKRLSKSEVKLTIRRLPDSIPLHCELC
uniref:Pleckstrin homology domain containing, family S member 1 n=1 Tax=Cyprinus carpio TaxID=7962 RepID=A0A8C1UIT0_CYPCA